MDRKKQTPEEKAYYIYKFLFRWRSVGVVFWTFLFNLLILNNKVIFSSLLSNFGPGVLSALTFIVLKNTLKPFYWCNFLSLCLSLLVYFYADPRVDASAWSEFSTVYHIVVPVLALGVHIFCLRYMFSVSHSRDSLLFYFPALISNLFVFSAVALANHSVINSLYQYSSVYTLNSVLLVLWFIYNEDYVFFFPFQQKKRIYQILEAFPQSCFLSLVWSGVNLLILSILYFVLLFIWKDVEVSFAQVRNIFYTNLIAFFLIKSSNLIFNAILTERANFTKIERDLGYPSDEKCETLIAAIKTQEQENGAQLLRYLAWRDLDRISLFEPAMISQFYKDKDSWEKISSCCFNEITSFTARMEKYCAKAMKPKEDESTTVGEDILYGFTSILKRIYGRRDEDKLFADFEVTTYAIKIIARLTVESKTKDISGTLQLQNQHKILLETLNKAYSAIDTYLKLKTKKNQQKTKALTQEIKQATYNITLAFYKYLGTVPISTYNTLQPFMDFVA